MNFFELINKTLLELNYKPVDAWNNLYTLEHRRVRDLLNRVNSEICHSCDWWFLERETTFTLAPTEQGIPLPVDGRVFEIKGENGVLKYNASYRDFFAKSQPENEFSLFNGKLLFHPSATAKEFKLVYFTNDTAKDAQKADKPTMTDETDESIIPIVDVEHLLVYGACMRMKANPAHNRFKYWFSMYSDAIENIRSRSDIVTGVNPTILMKRG